MKKLEEIKKKLPPGIDVRISSKNVITFRARFRLKGYPDQTKTSTDLKLAKKWLAEQQRNAEVGIHLPHIRASKHTVSEAIDRYITEILPRKPKNASNVRNHLERCRKEIGDYALSAVRPSMINEFRTKLENENTPKGKKRSSTTVLRYLTSLSHLFSVAVRDWEWMYENPVHKISKPQAAPGRQRYLSKEERVRLFEAIKISKCPVLYPIVILALSTGMRRGEIMNLHWKNIDFDQKKIILENTKNGNPRNVPLVGSALKEIKALYSLKGSPRQNDLLFSSPTDFNKPYDIQTAWEGALRRAKIEDFNFHDLRHSTASYQASNGRNLYEIGKLLGHESTQTTKRYAHLIDDHTTRMVEELDHEFFGGIQ